MAQYPSEQPSSSSLKLSDTLDSKAHQLLDAKEGKSTAAAAGNKQIQAFYEAIRKEMVSIYADIQLVVPGKIRLEDVHVETYGKNEERIREESRKALALSKKVADSLRGLFSKALPNDFENFTQDIKALRPVLEELKQLKEMISNYLQMVKNLGDMNSGYYKSAQQLFKESLETIESRLRKQIYCLEKFSSPPLVSLLNTKVFVSDFRHMYLQHIQRVNQLGKIYKETQELYKEVENEANRSVKALYEYYSKESVIPIDKEFQERVAALKQAVDRFSPEIYRGDEIVFGKINKLKILINIHEWSHHADGSSRWICRDTCLKKLESKIITLQHLWKDETFSPKRTIEQCKELGVNLLQSYEKAKAEAKTGLLPYEFLILRMQNPHIARDTLVGLTAMANEALAVLSKETLPTYLRTVHELLHQYREVVGILSYEIPLNVMQQADQELQRGNKLVNSFSPDFYNLYLDSKKRIYDIHKNIIDAEREANREDITVPIPSIPAMIFMCPPTTFLLSGPESISSNLLNASQALKQLIPIIMSYRNTFPVYRSKYGQHHVNLNIHLERVYQSIAECLFSWKMYSNELATKKLVDYKEVQRLTDQFSKIVRSAQNIYEKIANLTFDAAYQYSYAYKFYDKEEEKAYDQMKSSFGKLLLCFVNLPESYEQTLKEIDVVKGHVQALLKLKKSIFESRVFDFTMQIDSRLQSLKQELESSELSKIVLAKPENKKTEEVAEFKLDASSIAFQVQAQNAWSAFNFADEADKHQCLEVLLSHVRSLQQEAGSIDMLDPSLRAFLEKHSQEELAKEIQKRGGAGYIHSEYLQEEKGTRKKIDLNNLPKDFIRPMKIISILSKDLSAIPNVTLYMFYELCFLEIELLARELENLNSERASQESAGKLKEAFETQKAITQKEETIEWLQLVMGPSHNAQDLLWVRETLAQVYLNLRETKQGIPKSEYCQALDRLVSELKTEEDVIQRLEELEGLNCDKVRNKYRNKSVLKPQEITKVTNLLSQIHAGRHSLHVNLNSPFALFPSDIIALAESKGLQLSVATKDKAYAQEAENYRFKYEQYMQGKRENPAFDQRIANKYRAAMNKALAAVQDVTLLSEELRKFVDKEEYQRRLLSVSKIAPARALGLETEALKKALELEKEVKKDSDKKEDFDSILRNGQEVSRKERALGRLLVELEPKDPLAVSDRLWAGATLAEQLDHDMSIPVYIRAKDHLREAGKSMSAATRHLEELDEKINTVPKFKQLKEVIDALKAGRLKEILDNFQKIFENERSVVRHIMRPSFSPLDIIALAEHLGDKAKTKEFETARKWAGELNQAQQACRHWYEWREAKDAVKKQEHYAQMTGIIETIKTSVLYPKLQALFEDRLAPDIKATAKPVSSSSSSVVTPVAQESTSERHPAASLGDPGSLSIEMSAADNKAPVVLADQKKSGKPAPKDSFVDTVVGWFKSTPKSLVEPPKQEQSKISSGGFSLNLEDDSGVTDFAREYSVIGHDVGKK